MDKNVSGEPIWVLDPLRERVAHVHGLAQRARLEPCLRAVVRRLGFVRFHFREYRTAIDDFVADRAESVDETFEMMLPGMPIYRSIRSSENGATTRLRTLWP